MTKRRIPKHHQPGIHPNGAHAFAFASTLALALALATACGSSPDDDPGPDAAPELDPICDQLPPLPVAYGTLTGFSGSEDFAFDAEGNLVSVRDGNITRQTRDGSETLFVPNVGETAGMRFTSTGDLMVADVAYGDLLKISPEGVVEVVLSGIAYPNGVEVDMQDRVYVAEHDRGRVLQVDLATGDSQAVATGLINPNGLSFSPDYSKLYVGSFGGGTVHELGVDAGNNWEAPRLLGATPGLMEVCEGQNIGDPCDTPSLSGVCSDGGGGALVCGSPKPCFGAAEGDLCLSGFEAGLCADEGTGELSCSPEGNGPDLFIDACAAAGSGDPCEIKVAGATYPGICGDYDGQFLCVTDQDGASVCQGASTGDPCTAAEPWSGVYEGVCEDWGLLYCAPPLFFGDGGNGLDGMTVDTCGNVYVTEYISGIIWRFSSTGEREMVADVDSSWIPNMHWGTGIGGWETDVLYVMDREFGNLYELPVGVPEKERVYP